METEKLEKIVKEIKEKEDFLYHLENKDCLDIAYWHTRELNSVFHLSKKELNRLKRLFLLRIKELKEWIKKEII